MEPEAVIVTIDRIKISSEKHMEDNKLKEVFSAQNMETLLGKAFSIAELVVYWDLTYSPDKEYVINSKNHPELNYSWIWRGVLR